MNNIKLNFFGLNYSNEALICIYHYNKLIARKRTCNGIIYVNLKPNNNYKLVIETRYGRIVRNIYISSYLSNYIVRLVSSANMRTNALITFLLTDSYYDNLPIEKGMISLWQR